MKISIIIPIYNAEKYLNHCLNSICMQTYEDLEIICINGCSKDNSLEVIENYAQKDKRVRLYTISNEGVSASRNKGLDVATGDFIMFVDADDWIELNTCEIAINTVKEHDADVVMWTYMREFVGKPSPKKIFSCEKKVFETVSDVKNIHRRFIGLIGNELQEVGNADALCPVWGKLYRRDIIDNMQLRFVDIKKIGSYEDGLFNLHYFRSVKKIVYIEKFLYHYRKNTGVSITSKYNPKLFEQWIYLFKYMEDYIDEYNLGNEYYKALNNRICLSVLGQGLNILQSKKNAFFCIMKIKRMLLDKRYRIAYKSFDYAKMPFHFKVFYGCAKNNFAIGVYILLWIIKKLTT